MRLGVLPIVKFILGFNEFFGSLENLVLSLMCHYLLILSLNYKYKVMESNKKNGNLTK